MCHSNWLAVSCRILVSCCFVCETTGFKTDMRCIACSRTLPLDTLCRPGITDQVHSEPFAVPHLPANPLRLHCLGRAAFSVVHTLSPALA